MKRFSFRACKGPVQETLWFESLSAALAARANLMARGFVCSPINEQI